MAEEAEAPISGNQLAQKTNVSRQVIVQDISLLKAGNEPIMATHKAIFMRKKQVIQGKGALLP